MQCQKMSGRRTTALPTWGAVVHYRCGEGDRRQAIRTAIRVTTTATINTGQNIPQGLRTLQYGLIAEEVAEVYPDLVAMTLMAVPTR